MRASRRFWGKDWRGPNNGFPLHKDLTPFAPKNGGFTARPAFPQNHGFTLCKDLTHSRLLAGGSFSGTGCASRKQAFLRQKMLGNKLASLARDKRMTAGRRLLRTNALFRKKFQEGKPFCAKNAWKEAGSASVGSAHKRPQPSSEVLGKGLALFFPPNNGFPLCKDLSPLEEWLAKDDPLGFLNYPRPHGLALFFHGFTLLRNNPPQSLAQPTRQAYDYWQEVPLHKRKKPKKASLLAAKVSNIPAITRMQKLSAAQEATFARRVPPPTRGRFPLLPVCKSYQQCARPTAGPSSEVLGYIYLLIKGSTAPEPPLAVGRRVIACLFYCSPGICPQRGSHPTFGWGDTSAA